MPCLVDIGSQLFEQHAHNIHVPVLGRNVQGCGTVLNCLVDVGPQLFDQHAHNLNMP
jgi:hypothetical protein